MELPKRAAEAADNHQRFRQESLTALKQSLGTMSYPGYPLFDDRLWAEEDIYLRGHVELPVGKWETSNGETPSIPERTAFVQKGLSLDIYGRPLHPWFSDMLYDPDLGVVTGKGAYWEWGPNYTVDPIVIRQDLHEPHILLIQRGDTDYWALPGGFKDKDDEDSLHGALREAEEETGIDLSKFTYQAKPVYEGPVADLRTTAHAWPETAAFCFDLQIEGQKDLKLLKEMALGSRLQRVTRTLGNFALRRPQSTDMVWMGKDDARLAAWVPVSELHDKLFGSHRLLISMALNQF